MAELLKANNATAAAAAAAVTNQMILDRTAIFREAVAFPTSGLFFPGPDFFAGAADSAIVIRVVDNNDTGSITNNDLYANGPTGSIGFFPGASEVLSVAVLAANGARISATLAGGSITVTAFSGFQGTSYFDYRIRHSSGEEGTARIYVLFR